MRLKFYPNLILLKFLLNLHKGTLGVLDKTRHLFMHDRTRIHLDEVKNKGSNYYGIEFEVIMKTGEELEVGQKVAEELMEIFQLKQDQLLEGSYFEILNP